MYKLITFLLSILCIFNTIVAQCDTTGTYNSCCPAFNTKQVTFATKPYTIHCDKEIVPIQTPIQNPTPKDCINECNGNQNCVNAYWHGDGRCVLSGLAAPKLQGKQSLLRVAMIPVTASQPKNCDAEEKAAKAKCENDKDTECATKVTKCQTDKDNECAGKITTAVNKCKGDKDTECDGKITTAVNKCKGDKDTECNGKVTTAVNNCKRDKDTECSGKITTAVNNCKRDKDTECNGKITTAVNNCKRDKDTECNGKITTAVKNCKRDKDTECSGKITTAVNNCKRNKDAECKRKVAETAAAWKKRYDALKKRLEACQKKPNVNPNKPKQPSDLHKSPWEVCGQPKVQVIGGRRFNVWYLCTVSGPYIGNSAPASSVEQCALMCSRMPGCGMANLFKTRSTLCFFQPRWDAKVYYANTHQANAPVWLIMPA